MYEVDQNDSYISAGVLTADVTGTAIDTRGHSTIAFQAVWTGAGVPVGNFTIQVSLDATTWSDYPSSSTAAGGAAGDKMWMITNTVAKWYRLKYTRTSGGTADTVTVKTYAKGAV